MVRGRGPSPICVPMDTQRMEKTLLSPVDFLCTFVENWPYISGSVSGLSTLFHSYVVYSNVLKPGDICPPDSLLSHLDQVL